MCIDQLGREVGIGSIRAHVQVHRDRSDHSRVFGERRGLEHQHVVALGERLAGKSRAKKTRVLALVESTAFENRLTRRQAAADGRHRIPGIEIVVERRCVGSRQRGIQPAVGVEVVTDEAGIGQRPIVGGDPAAAVIQTPFGVAPSRTASHHEQPHRGLGLDAIGDPSHPMIEPALAERPPVGRDVAVECRRRAKIHVAGGSGIAIAVQPGPHDQPHRPMFLARERDIVFGRGTNVRVVPARNVHLRYIGGAVVISRGVDAELLPIAVEIPVLPLLEQVALVLGHGANRRMSTRPRHVPEP